MKYYGYNINGKVSAFPAYRKRGDKMPRYIVAVRNNENFFIEENGKVTPNTAFSVNQVLENVASQDWKRYARRPKWLKKGFDKSAAAK